MTLKFNVVGLKKRRRSLRSSATLSEQLLWSRIRNRKLGFRFVRQFSIEGYVLDFYSPEARLGIEVEGEIHLLSDVKTYDNYRERYLTAFDLRILKFSNKEVTHDLNGVLSRISLSLPKRGIKGEF